VAALTAPHSGEAGDADPAASGSVRDLHGSLFDVARAIVARVLLSIRIELQLIVTLALLATLTAAVGYFKAASFNNPFLFPQVGVPACRGIGTEAGQQAARPIRLSRFEADRREAPLEPSPAE
jgi:hypothetical protein